MAETVDVNELGRSVDPRSLSDEALIGTLTVALRDGDPAEVDPSLFARLVRSASRQPGPSSSRSSRTTPTRSRCS
jgi:hypothetical protein